MKYSILILTITTILLVIVGCAISKKSTKSNSLQETWELNYISGKRMAL